MCAPPKEVIDVEVLCAMSQLEPSETFAKMTKIAYETLDKSIYGSRDKANQGQTLEEAKKQVERKVPVLKQQHAKAVSAANERNYNMTPEYMKELLPGGGAIRGLFWGRFNPVECWFRITYPCSILAQVSHRGNHHV